MLKLCQIVRLLIANCFQAGLPCSAPKGKKAEGSWRHKIAALVSFWYGKWEGTGNHICLLSFFENQLSYKSGLRFYVELLPFKTGPILQKCKNFGWQEMAQPGAIHLFINIATFIGNLFSWIYCMSFDFICRILGTFRSNFIKDTCKLNLNAWLTT